MGYVIRKEDDVYKLFKVSEDTEFFVRKVSLDNYFELERTVQMFKGEEPIIVEYKIDKTWKWLSSHIA